MKNELPNCARCPYNNADRLCRKENGKSPSFCPTRNKSDLIENCLDEYKMSDNSEFARQSSIQEADGYIQREKGYGHVKPAKPRIEEIIEFCQKMKYRRLGLAFCCPTEALFSFLRYARLGGYQKNKSASVTSKKFLWETLRPCAIRSHRHLF